MPVKSDFGYNGDNAEAGKFVDAVNSLARLFNGFRVDFGAAQGGDNLVRADQRDDGMVLDFTAVSFGGDGGLPSGSGEFKVLQLDGFDDPIWDYTRAH